VTLARVREAVKASQVGAAELVENLPAERVGLVASVAACCATYAAAADVNERARRGER
jgi:hypothetical protein